MLITVSKKVCLLFMMGILLFKVYLFISWYTDMKLRKLRRDLKKRDDYSAAVSSNSSSSSLVVPDTSSTSSAAAACRLSYISHKNKALSLKKKLPFLNYHIDSLRHYNAWKNTQIQTSKELFEFGIEEPT